MQLIVCVGAPANSFIHTDRFENVSELARHLTHLTRNESAYQSHFAWRRSLRVSGFDDKRNNVFCQLCAFLHNDDPDPHPDSDPDPKRDPDRGREEPTVADRGSGQHQQFFSTHRHRQQRSASVNAEDQRDPPFQQEQRARPDVLWDATRKCRDEHSSWPLVSSFKYYTGS